MTKCKCLISTPHTGTEILNIRTSISSQTSVQCLMVSGICKWTQRINLSAPDVGNESKRNAGWFIGPWLKPQAQWSCFQSLRVGLLSALISVIVTVWPLELQAPIPWAGTERINQSLQCHDGPESSPLWEPKHSHWSKTAAHIHPTWTASLTFCWLPQNIMFVSYQTTCAILLLPWTFPA